MQLYLHDSDVANFFYKGQRRLFLFVILVILFFFLDYFLFPLNPKKIHSCFEENILLVRK